MTCPYETERIAEDRDRLAHDQEVADPYRVLATSGNASGGLRPCGGCHAAREHGSTCQLSALPHGAAARTTVCGFGSLKPSDRSSGLRSFGLSAADHSGSLSGSGPMQQRLVCVEAGQMFSIPRVEVLTPQVSGSHCRLTRGRSLVRSQSGPQPVYLRKHPHARTGFSSWIFLRVRSCPVGKALFSCIWSRLVALRAAERRPQSKNQTG
jgi:hypothetical protein